jgi:hypothetical protein
MTLLFAEAQTIRLYVYLVLPYEMSASNHAYRLRLTSFSQIGSTKVVEIYIFISSAVTHAHGI